MKAEYFLLMCMTTIFMVVIQVVCIDTVATTLACAEKLEDLWLVYPVSLIENYAHCRIYRVGWNELTNLDTSYLISLGSKIDCG
jgi:hypothetical protein